MDRGIGFAPHPMAAHSVLYDHRGSAEHKALVQSSRFAPYVVEDVRQLLADCSQFPDSRSTFPSRNLNVYSDTYGRDP